MARQNLGIVDDEEFGCLTAERFELQLECRRDELRGTFGQMMAVIANAAPFRAENATVSKASDFFPDPREEEIDNRQTPEDHVLILSKLFKRPPKK